jgi:hypothetical protein
MDLAAASTSAHPIGMPRPILFSLALAVLLSARAGAQAAASSAAPIVVDASRFVGQIARGHVITDAAALRVPWVFNNTALQMRTTSWATAPTR